jgi:hypothetical protein
MKGWIAILPTRRLDFAVGKCAEPLRLLAIIFLFLLVGCGKSQRRDSFLDDLKALPPAKVEVMLPNEEPSAYYVYAERLFQEGKKDDAVFWFYVGELRCRFYLDTNPHLPPGGASTTFNALRVTLGPTISGYAGGNVKEWVKAIDRALAWDAAVTNGVTSKEKFPVTYKEIRAELRKVRDQLESRADTIRAQRKEAGLENRE